MTFIIVEKKNPLAVHGVFDTKDRAERDLLINVPDHCNRGFYMDKTLTPDDFEIISKT